MNTGEIVENGAWSVSTNEEDGKVFIQSDDFTHDIRLYVNGDFRYSALCEWRFQDGEQRVAFANEIALSLNAWPSLNRYIKEFEDHRTCVEASIKRGARNARF